MASARAAGLQACTCRGRKRFGFVVARKTPPTKGRRRSTRQGGKDIAGISAVPRSQKRNWHNDRRRFTRYTARRQTHPNTDGDLRLCAISREKAEMKNDELMLRLITSQAVRMKLDEFVMLFRHRFMLVLYLMPTLTLALTNVRASQGMPRWASMSLHTLGVFLFVVTLVVIVIALRRLLRRSPVLRLHMTPLILAALGVSFGTTDWIAFRMTGRALEFPTQKVPFFLMVWCVTEITFSISSRFVLPRALADLRGRQGAAAADAVAGGAGEAEPTPQTAFDPQPETPPVLADFPPLPEHVMVGGRRLALADLSYIVADGNAVQVHFGARSLRLSARFSNVIAAIPVQAGMQIHRSVWVSAAQAARAGYDRAGREAVLRLADGTVLPVAQSRRTEVAAWLRGLGLRDV